jgi:hypothetical protein
MVKCTLECPSTEFAKGKRVKNVRNRLSSHTTGAEWPRPTKQSAL